MHFEVFISEVRLSKSQPSWLGKLLFYFDLIVVVENNQEILLLLKT